MNDQEFVQSMGALKGQVAYLPSTISAALTDILGELGAASTLSYTGDASDGNLVSFARRMDELFGDGSPKVLTEIVFWVTTSVKKS